MKHTKNFIESTYILRKNLGQHLEKIRQLDPLPHEREKTNTIRQKLIKRYGEKCAYCQKSGVIQAAHIIPLEVGGITDEENLILLCKKYHRLYDSGFLSIQAMRDFATKWRKSTIVQKPPMLSDDFVPPSPEITPPPQAIQVDWKKVRRLQYKAHFRKAISILDRACNSSLDYDSQSYLLIRRAELTRRRSKHGVLNEALNTLQNINPQKLSEKYRPVYYYELAYVYRLSGNHKKAAKVIGISAEVSLKMNQSNTVPVGYIAASANKILCLLVTEKSISKDRANEFVDKLQELEYISAKHGGYWGGRWALNCAYHRLQVHLKRQNKEKSWDSLLHLLDKYYCSDLSNGWDKGTIASISLIKGLTLTIVPQKAADIDMGINLLARAFVTRLGYRQRLEGIRDVGFGLVKAIRNTKNANMPITKQTVDFIESLMVRTVDGTSVLWPWRANS